jgi:hypothetical protein
MGQNSIHRCPENGELGQSIHLQFGCHGTARLVAPLSRSFAATERVPRQL